MSMLFFRKPHAFGCCRISFEASKWLEIRSCSCSFTCFQNVYLYIYIIYINKSTFFFFYLSLSQFSLSLSMYYINKKNIYKYIYMYVYYYTFGYGLSFSRPGTLWRLERSQVRLSASRLRRLRSDSPVGWWLVTKFCWGMIYTLW